MRYKISKKQVEMLIAGKPLSNGKEKIYATQNIKEQLEDILEKNIMERANVIVNVEGAFHKQYSILIEDK